MVQFIRSVVAVLREQNLLFLSNTTALNAEGNPLKSQCDFPFLSPSPFLLTLYHFRTLVLASLRSRGRVSHPFRSCVLLRSPLANVFVRTRSCKRYK